MDKRYHPRTRLLSHSASRIRDSPVIVVPMIKGLAQRMNFSLATVAMTLGHFNHARKAITERFLSRAFDYATSKVEEKLCAEIDGCNCSFDVQPLPDELRKQCSWADQDWLEDGQFELPFQSLIRISNDHQWGFMLEEVRKRWPVGRFVFFEMVDVFILCSQKLTAHRDRKIRPESPIRLRHKRKVRWRITIEMKLRIRDLINSRRKLRWGRPYMTIVSYPTTRRNASCILFPFRISDYGEKGSYLLVGISQITS